MFDLINGLPVHPLVVHGVVVLGPISALMLVAYVLRPGWRYGLRWPLVALAVIAAGSAFVAKESGEQLEHRVGDPGMHAEWGDRAFLATALMMVVTLVVVFVLARAYPVGATQPPADVKRWIALALAVVSAAAVLFTIFQAGDSGASQVWKDQVTTKSGG